MLTKVIRIIRFCRTPLLGASKVIDRYNVFTCNDALLLSGVPDEMPGALIMPVATENGIGIGIVVNSRFHKMPEWWQTVALAHEEGHINLNHLEKAKWYYGILRLFREDPMEFAADIFAANLHGKEQVIRFLQEYKRFKVKHINTRIKHLKEMS